MVIYNANYHRRAESTHLDFGGQLVSGRLEAIEERSQWARRWRLGFNKVTDEIHLILELQQRGIGLIPSATHVRVGGQALVWYVGWCMEVGISAGWGWWIVLVADTTTKARAVWRVLLLRRFYLSLFGRRLLSVIYCSAPPSPLACSRTILLYYSS